MGEYILLLGLAFGLCAFSLGLILGKRSGDKRCQEELDNLQDILFEEEGRGYERN